MKFIPEGLGDENPTGTVESQGGVHNPILVRGFPFVNPAANRAYELPLRDEAHIKDLDEAGLLTPEIEASLPPELMDRLVRTRQR